MQAHSKLLLLAGTMQRVRHEHPIQWRLSCSLPLATRSTHDTPFLPLIVLSTGEDPFLSLSCSSGSPGEGNLSLVLSRWKNAVDAPAGNVLVTYDVIANFSALNLLLDLRSHGSSLSEKMPLAVTWSHVPSTSWLHMPYIMCFFLYMYFVFKINNSVINETW